MAAVAGPSPASAARACRQSHRRDVVLSLTPALWRRSCGPDRARGRARLNARTLTCRGAHIQARDRRGADHAGEHAQQSDERHRPKRHQAQLARAEARARLCQPHAFGAHGLRRLGQVPGLRRQRAHGLCAERHRAVVLQSALALCAQGMHGERVCESFITDGEQCCEVDLAPASARPARLSRGLSWQDELPFGERGRRDARRGEARLVCGAGAHASQGQVSSEGVCGRQDEGMTGGQAGWGGGCAR